MKDRRLTLTRALRDRPSRDCVSRVCEQGQVSRCTWMYYNDSLGRMTKRTDNTEGDSAWVYDDTVLSGAKANQ